MKSNRPSGRIALLLEMVDDNFGGKAWHGPTLRGSLRGLSHVDAAAGIPDAKHCIAEIAVHCAYWKYAARRRLRGDARGSFPLKGSNWFALPDPLDAGAWKSMLKLLDAEHALLCEAIAGVRDRQLDVVPKGSRVTNRKLIYGIASHDVYHAGQIRLIKASLGRES